jgi:UDP-glucose-4-epimerase GalE
MAKILLTGGAGYIGSHTNLALSESGHETVVFDNLSTGFERAVDGDLVIGDLLEKDSIEGLLRRERFDIVIHFAAKTFVGESFENPSKYWNNNVVGTRNLLDAMARFGPDKIVFSSSCALYGEPAYVPIDEDHPLAPLNPYGKTKLVCEWMIEDEGRSNGLRYANLRYFNAVGADPKGRLGLLAPNHPQLLNVCLDVSLGVKQKLLVFGDDYPTPDGTCIRDYIHVSDLAGAHVAAAKKLLDADCSFTVNLGVGRGFSVSEVVRAVEAECGNPLPMEIVARRSGDPAISIADPSAAFDLLGWKPRLADLETIVGTAYRWRVANLEGDANPSR